MVAKRRIHIIVLCGVFLFILDQIAKQYAVLHSTASWYIWRPWLGWEYFLNPGIAFSLPFPNLLLLTLTPIILLFLIFWFRQTPRDHRTLAQSIGVTGILLGATSNFIDRVWIGATIDYLRLFTAIINIADILIVVGVIALLVHFQKNAAYLP